MTRKSSKPSRLQAEVAPWTTQVLTGTLLAIDPSSGSRGSMPGYALFQGGRLVDSGLIQVRYTDVLHKRLQYLLHVLQSEFKRPDVMVTEFISPFIQSGDQADGNRFFNKSMVSLQRAVSVVQACFHEVPVIEVAPRTWRSHIPEGYKKTDESDSIMLALCTIWTAQDIEGIARTPIDARLMHKLETGEWPNG